METTPYYEIISASTPQLPDSVLGSTTFSVVPRRADLWYAGMPLSKGGNNTEAESEEAKQQFLAGEGGILGFTRSQMNGIWGSAAGSWRTMSFIGQVPVPPDLYHCLKMMLGF